MIFLLLKAKRAQIGEVRHRKSGPYQKVSPTKWIPVKKVGNKWVSIEKKKKKEMSKESSIDKLSKLIKKIRILESQAKKARKENDSERLSKILKESKPYIDRANRLHNEAEPSVKKKMRQIALEAREPIIEEKEKKGLKEGLDIGKKIGETLTEPTVGKLAETAIGTAKALTPERKKQIVKENKESFHSPSRFINFGNAPKYMPLKDREKLFAIDMKLSDEKYKAENLSRRSTPKSVYKKGDKAIREWRKKNNERIKKYKAKAKELREKGRALKKKHVELSKRPAKKK